MRNLFSTLLIFCSLLAIGQEQLLQYKNVPLQDVIADVEDRFDIRFSYKSNLITAEVFSYNGKVDLKTFLNVISEEKNLEFIFLGSGNVVIKSSFDQNLNTNELDEVVLVTEYLTSGFDQSIKDGSIRMKPNRLGILPGLTEPDILQSLQLLPGISSPTESASNLHIRGGTPDQNLILYDGIKIYHQGHLFGMISPFNPYVVESVNVFRSGTKSEFGDRIAGVIDINSLKEVPYETTGGAGMNFLHGDVFIKTPLQKDKIGFLFSARRSINDIVNLPTFNSLSDKVFQNTIIEQINDLIDTEELEVLDDTFTFLDINSKLIFKPNKQHEISISSLLVDNSLNYANVDVDGFGSRDQLDLVNKGLSAFWNYQITQSWNLRSSFYYSNFNSKYQFNEISNDPFAYSASNNNSVKDFGFQIHSRHKIQKNFALKLGYELVNYDVSYNLTFADEDEVIEDVATELSIHNAFAEIEYEQGNFFIRGGLRAGIYSASSQTLFEPRIYTHYNVSDSFKLKASYETKNQAISQLVSFDFNDLGLGDTVWVLADEDEEIPVLNNRQFTVGFFFQKDGWKLDAEYYHKKIKGLTSFTRGFGSSAINEDYAFGNSTVFGIDILLKKKINKFRTWIGYSYSKNDFEFSDLQDEKFPGNFDQRHVLSWTNSYKHNQFQFSLGWQFATGRPYSQATGITDDVIAFNEQNNVRLSNYHKLDASASYDFYLDSDHKVRARLGVSVINIYNRRNQIDRNFRITEDLDGNSVLSEQTSVGLKITPNMVFRVYF